MTPDDPVHDPAPGPLVSGADNFRDVGGLRAGAHRTRTGVLFRSGNLARLDDGGRQALAELGIRRIIDLRADEEVHRSPSLVAGLDLETQRVPLFLGSVASLFEEDLTLGQMYARIVEDSSAGVVEVVRGIIADQPVIVHCTVGKDRTGVTVALALAAAGVDDEAVVADYARTEALLPEERNRQVSDLLRSMHPDAVNVIDLATRSPAHVMRELLADLTARYGSVGDYLLAHGLTSHELEKLRAVLIAQD
ncbi:MAG: tyrosine-protein phosphatase [Microbacterium sp.]